MSQDAHLERMAPDLEHISPGMPTWADSSGQLRTSFQVCRPSWLIVGPGGGSHRCKWQGTVSQWPCRAMEIHTCGLAVLVHDRRSRKSFGSHTDAGLPCTTSGSPHNAKLTVLSWPYSSVVEHAIADRRVSCSNHDEASSFSVWCRGLWAFFLGMSPVEVAIGNRCKYSETTAHSNNHPLQPSVNQVSPRYHIRIT